MESIYEFGSRVGAWRILREFERRALPLTVFGVAMAMQRHPDFVRACVEAGHEIASHGEESHGGVRRDQHLRRRSDRQLVRWRDAVLLQPGCDAGHRDVWL